MAMITLETGRKGCIPHYINRECYELQVSQSDYIVHHGSYIFEAGSYPLVIVLYQRDQTTFSDHN